MVKGGLPALLRSVQTKPLIDVVQKHSEVNPKSPAPFLRTIL